MCDLSPLAFSHVRKAHRLLIAHHKNVNNAFISGEPVTRPTIKTDLYDAVEFGVSGISNVFSIGPCCSMLDIAFQRKNHYPGDVLGKSMHYLAVLNNWDW